MNAEKVVKALLAADASVVGFVGTKIYGGVDEQDAVPPFVIYRKLPGTTRDVNEALDPTEPGAQVVTAPIEVLCVASDYEVMKQLGMAVRAALVYKSGTIAGVTLLGIELQDEGGDDFSLEAQVHMQGFVYQVKHEE